ncbi:MAG: hypothetical protein Q9163_002186 [Psora crenata]
MADVPASEHTTSSTLDRIRIRNNQRRARARQKEYIQDLEAKLQNYERKGVEATIEVQNAARSVAEENVRLRAEVESLRQENAQLKELLGDEGCGGIQAKATDYGGLMLTDDNGVTQRLQQDKTTCSNKTTGIDCGFTSTSMTLMDDTSSCEYAAHIITSMRADVTTDDIRAELGCADEQEFKSCRVDNGTLFLAMDRYAT